MAQLWSCVGVLYMNYIILLTYNLMRFRVRPKKSRLHPIYWQFTTLTPPNYFSTPSFERRRHEDLSQSRALRADCYNCCKTAVSQPQSGEPKAGFSPGIPNEMMTLYCSLYCHWNISSLFIFLHLCIVLFCIALFVCDRLNLNGDKRQRRRQKEKQITCAVTVLWPQAAPSRLPGPPCPSPPPYNAVTAALKAFLTIHTRT